MVKRLNDLQGKILINLFALLEVHTDNIDFIFLEMLKLMWRKRGSHTGVLTLGNVDVTFLRDMQEVSPNWWVM